MDAYRGELAALLTAVFWTGSALSFEWAGKRVGSLAVNLWRLVLAFGLLMIYRGIADGSVWPEEATESQWLWLSLSGIVGFALGDLFLFRAFVVIGSRLSMLIMALVPPITALFGYLALGETLSLLNWAGMTLTLLGVGWVVLERAPSEGAATGRIPLSGLLLGLGAAMGQAGGLILSKMGVRDFDPFAAAQIRILSGSAGFVVLFTLIGWWRPVFAAWRDRPAMGRIFLGAICGPFLGVSFSLVSVKYAEAGVAATLMALVPVMIIPPVIWLYKERISPRALLGAILAVIGASLLFWPDPGIF